MNKTIAVPKRRKKWLCVEIDNTMNTVYSDIMEVNTCYIQDTDDKAEYTAILIRRSIDNLISLQKPLMIMWNVQNTKRKQWSNGLLSLNENFCF